MAASRKIIYSSVGDNEKNNKKDVQSIQQLLNTAGYNAGLDDGLWGNKTRAALYRFETRNDNNTDENSNGLKDEIPTSYSPTIESNSNLPLEIAKVAKILMPIPRKKGMAGVKELHNFFHTNKTPYNEGAQDGQGDRAFYGIVGKREYAIQRAQKKFTGPLEMDCTTYVNLMVSIYLQGHIQTAPYDASCANFGGTSTIHCARDRYNFKLVKRKDGKKTYRAFSTYEQLVEPLKNHQTKLHVIEIGRGAAGAVKHMAMCYGLTIYECTTGQANGACISRSLKDFMRNKKGTIIYLFREPSV